MRTFSRWLVGLLFILAGLNHFRSPGVYVSIVPPIFPQREAIVFWSGVAEILGGVGILVPMTRRPAMWGLLALLVAVFPAHIYCLTAGMEIGGKPVPTWMLWARLPIQPLMMWWVWWSASRPNNSQ